MKSQRKFQQPLSRVYQRSPLDLPFHLMLIYSLIQALFIPIKRVDGNKIVLEGLSLTAAWRFILHLVEKYFLLTVPCVIFSLGSS